jgi:hypothetical protein
MAAAAACAGIAVSVVGEPHDITSASVTVVVATLGGVVEGTAVGVVQLSLLRRWLPQLGARFVLATVAAAALGWFLGMLPSTAAQWAASGESAATSTVDGGPPSWLMPIAGLLLGALLGAMFGAVQAAVLRHHVCAARRWVWANMLGWSVAMAVIMTGASAPSGPWPAAQLLVFAAATGVLAGLALGAITGLFLPAIDDDAPLPAHVSGRMVCRLLRSPAHRLASGSLLELRYTGARSGTQYVLPVQYATEGSSVVVWPAHSEAKTWWRNLRDPTPVSTVLHGVERPGTAQVLRGPGVAWTTAARCYESRFPRVSLSVLDPLVEISLGEVTPEDLQRSAAAAPR